MDGRGGGRDLDNALAWARKAVELDPNSVAFADTLGWVYRARKDYAKAASVLNGAVKSGRTMRMHIIVLASCIRMGEKERISEALKKALPSKKMPTGQMTPESSLKSCSNNPHALPLVKQGSSPWRRIRSEYPCPLPA